MDFGMMTPQHAIFIPCVLAIGLIVGYSLGSRAVRNEYERRRRNMKE